jgi:hypothetical protein
VPATATSSPARPVKAQATGSGAVVVPGRDRLQGPDGRQHIAISGSSSNASQIDINDAGNDAVAAAATLFVSALPQSVSGGV